MDQEKSPARKTLLSVPRLTFDPPEGRTSAAGSALVNGVVYIAYASHGDRLFIRLDRWAINASTLAQVRYLTTPLLAHPMVRRWNLEAGGAPSADSGNQPLT